MATTTRKKTTTKTANSEKFDFKIRDDAADRLQDFMNDPDVLFVGSVEEAQRLGVDLVQQMNNIKGLLKVLLDDEQYTKLRDHLQKTEKKRGVTEDMMKTPISAFLDDGTRRIDIAVAGGDLDTPYHFGERQMKGFYSTPAIKTSLTEAQTRNGAHAISHGVLFAARVVSIPFIITASNRTELDDLKTALQLFVGKSDVVYQVNDGSDSTFVTGMLSIEYSVDIDECNTKGEMTLTCKDAERLSASEYSTNIGFGLASTGGGMG